MRLEQMANHLALEFLSKGYEWEFPNGEKRIPTEKDFTTALEHARDSLSEHTSIFMGRLVISKSQGHLDVYLHQGEIE